MKSGFVDKLVAHLKPRLSVAVLFLAVWPALPVAGREPSPSALQIFDAALLKFESDQRALRPWQYYQTLTTQQLDGAGKVVASGTWKCIVRPGDPNPPEYVFEKREGRLSFFSPSSEEPTSTPGKSPPPKPKAASDPEKNQTEFALDAVRKYKLRDRYQWHRLPDEKIADESAYVISFAPKPKQTSRSREERFFSLLAGRLWISRSDYSLLKAEAALQSPCSLFWIIARVTTFEFTYEVEQNPTSNRLLRPSRATARTVLTFPFFSVRQRHRQTIDKYEPRTPRGSVTSHL